MTRLVLSPAAAEDIRSIWSTVAEHNLTAADRLIDRIDGALKRLVMFPSIGHARPDVAKREYRFIVVRPYVIAYRHDEPSITVIRVLHGRREVREALQ